MYVTNPACTCISTLYLCYVDTAVTIDLSKRRKEKQTIQQSHHRKQLKVKFSPTIMSKHHHRSYSDSVFERLVRTSHHSVQTNAATNAKNTSNTSNVIVDIINGSNRSPSSIESIQISALEPLSTIGTVSVGSTAVSSLTNDDDDEISIGTFSVDSKFVRSDVIHMKQFFAADGSYSECISSNCVVAGRGRDVDEYSGNVLWRDDAKMLQEQNSPEFIKCHMIAISEILIQKVVARDGKFWRYHDDINLEDGTKRRSFFPMTDEDILKKASAVLREPKKVDKDIL